MPCPPVRLSQTCSVHRSLFRLPSERAEARQLRMRIQTRTSLRAGLSAPAAVAHPGQAAPGLREPTGRWRASMGPPHARAAVVSRQVCAPRSMAAAASPGRENGEREAASARSPANRPFAGREVHLVSGVAEKALREELAADDHVPAHGEDADQGQAARRSAYIALRARFGESQQLRRPPAAPAAPASRAGSAGRPARCHSRVCTMKSRLRNDSSAS